MKNILVAVFLLMIGISVHASRGRARTMIDRMERIKNGKSNSKKSN